MFKKIIFDNHKCKIIEVGQSIGKNKIFREALENALLTATQNNPAWRTKVNLLLNNSYCFDKFIMELGNEYFINLSTKVQAKLIAKKLNSI